MSATARLDLLRATRAPRRVLAGLGVPGTIGLVLGLVGAVTLMALQVMPATPDAPATTEPPAVAAAPAPIASADAAAPPPIEVFTRPEQVNASVLRIFQAARKHRIELTEGEYRFGAREAGWQAYSIALPVKGSYAAIRRFLAQTLADNPRLALDALELRRESIGDPTVTARVRFSLFVAEAKP